MISSELVAKLYQEVDSEEKARSVIQIVDNCRLDIHNTEIGITDENLEEKLVEWLRDKKKYYLDDNSTDSYNCFVYHYDKQSYDDTFSTDEVKEIISGKTTDDRRDNFYNRIFEEYWFIEYQDMVFMELVNDFCNDTGYEQHDTEIQDILVNIIEFDFDTYLDDEFNVNLIIDFNNQDSDTEFSNSSNLENTKNNNLYTLLKKQGYTKKDYEDELKKAVYNEYGYIKCEDSVKNGCNKFLMSVREEIENNNYECLTTLVVLQKRTLRELIESDHFEVRKDDTIGLFNECYGSGSLLGIELEKGFTLDREKDIYKIQVEGTKQNFGYSVDEVYGLIDSCWK